MRRMIIGPRPPFWRFCPVWPAACGSKSQDGTGAGDVLSILADGSTGKGVLADGRQPDKDMSADYEGTEQEALAWPGIYGEYAPQAP
ncbi:hypothetical protein [Flintibacter sp.]|uniref:hypothetical protein n=1 Tax=Flintibacter sp. TaxID=1918624 RepID=UPI003A307F9F